MTGFPQLLRQVREAAGLSQNALGRRIEINPGTINRLETGEREPTGRDQVAALAAGIGLGEAETNRLIAAAGFAPAAYDAVGLDNPALLQVATFLSDGKPEEREAFRQALAFVLAAPGDPTLQAVVAILGDHLIPADEQRDFRLQVALAARRWRAAPLP